MCRGFSTIIFNLALILLVLKTNSPAADWWCGCGNPPILVVKDLNLRSNDKVYKVSSPYGVRDLEEEGECGAKELASCQPVPRMSLHTYELPVLLEVRKKVLSSFLVLLHWKVQSYELTK